MTQGANNKRVGTPDILQPPAYIFLVLLESGNQGVSVPDMANRIKLPADTVFRHVESYRKRGWITAETADGPMRDGAKAPVRVKVFRLRPEKYEDARDYVRSLCDNEIFIGYAKRCGLNLDLVNDPSVDSGTPDPNAS